MAKPCEQVHKKSDEVVKFLKGYIKFLLNSCKDETSDAYKERFPLVQYWQNVVDILSKDLRMVGEGQQDMPLKHGFWPRTNHGTGVNANRDASSPVMMPSNETIENVDMVELQNEYVEELANQARPFVGSRLEREPGRWIPLQDIQEGHFLFLNPEEQ